MRLLFVLISTITFSLLWCKIFPIETKPIVLSADVGGSDVFCQVNDHLEVDIDRLGLTEFQKSQIDTVLKSPILQNQNIRDYSKSTNYEITPHLVYRYFAAVDWTPTYHNTKVEDAIAETILWRYNFGIHKISDITIKALVKGQFSYTARNADKLKRSIIYLNMGKMPAEKQSPETFLDLMMYTVERADRLSLQFGSGEFITVIDMSNFSITNCPPVFKMKESVGLLKKHYPYRLGGILLINAGLAFNIIWNILKPFVPKKALSKIFILNDNEKLKRLDDLVGLENLERHYGGKLDVSVGTTDDEFEEYFRMGFWNGASNEDESKRRVLD